MTVTVTYSPLTYNCNGSTTAFSVTWPFFLSSDLVVTHITSGGVETALVLNTDYTVSGGRDSTTGLPAVGTVTTLSTYASGVKIRISRSTPKTQSTSFTTAGAFPAKTVEAMIDRVHMIAEEGAGGSPAQDVDGSSLRLETGGATDYWDGEDYIARGFADPTGDTDLVTKGYADDNYGGAVVTAAAASATAAAASASAAATSASAAATSATVAEINAGFTFTYSTTTSMADPGAGVIRLNNATLASVTAIAIDDLSANTGNPDVSAWVLTFDDSTNATHKGLLRLLKRSAPENFVDYAVTGLTDNSGWTQLAVTYVTHSGSFSNSDSLVAAFYRSGDKGTDGAGAGDVVGPASSVDSEIALFSSTTGKLIKRASTTGIVKATSGVISAAVSGTDYAPATSGTAILKGNGSGGFSAASGGTDYANASHTHTQSDLTGLTTADSPQFAGINLGHASDTTLTRAASGKMAVEGNQVPSPGSVAQGDVLYYDGSTWARLGAGTSGQFLKTNGAGANPAWADGGSTVGTPVTSGTIGYGTGTGGAVTQATSITTGVTLNKAAGAITLYSSSTLTADTVTSFTLTNSTIAATDVVLVTWKTNVTHKVSIYVSAITGGSCKINMVNHDTTTDLIVSSYVLNFVVIKAATS